MSECIRVFGAG